MIYEIVTILIVDNMGYYGIFWDNSLGDLINKSQQRKNEEQVFGCNQKHRNHEHSFNFCPYSESKNRILR